MEREMEVVFLYMFNIPSRKLKIHNTPEDIENIFFEINLMKTKWLFCGCYHLPGQTDQYFFENVGKTLDKYSKHYVKFILVGDFSAEESEPCLSQFLYDYNAKNIVKENTCFKNALNPSSIHLFITNSPLSFQNTIAVSNGLSDFHKMVITVMEISFKKHSPIERYYSDCKYFDWAKCKNNLNEKLSEGISKYESFETTFIEKLNKHAPLQKKFLRVNQAPYLTKTLRKAIMHRSQLETKHLKTKTQTDLKLYKMHKNFCIKFYKEERRNILSP